MQRRWAWPNICAGEPICVILGDNIIENNICEPSRISKQQKGGAKILLKEVTDAQRFGVAEIAAIASWASKKNPNSEIELRRHRNLSLRQDRVPKNSPLEASGRGELEITDVNNFYIEEAS